MNIPPPDEGRLAFYGRKTKWVLFALLAPEAVLYAAWIQWFNARWLCAQFAQDSQGSQGSTQGFQGSFGEQKPEQEHITLSQGFYVAMGGIVVDIPETSEIRAMEGLGDVKRTTLGIDEVHTLFLNGYRGFIPSDGDIRDKSKADILAKGLILFQVLWMVIQVCSSVFDSFVDRLGWTRVAY
jgi:hypothetical protein